MLENTRRLVRAHPEVLEGFPRPTYPQTVTEMGERFVSFLRGTGTATPKDVSWACDELLLSTDREVLSTMQCAVCGCAILEAFAVDEAQGRGSPSIFTALQAIWPAISLMSVRALASVRRALVSLPRSIVLDDDELAAVLVGNDLLCALVGRAPLVCTGKLEDALDLWADDLDWLLPALEECEAMPEARKALYRECAARAKERWQD